MSSETRYLYEFGAFCLDPAERQLLRDGKPVPLPPKAFLTLVLLVERNGRVREKQELMQAVWPGTFVEENNLTQCISLLRKTLAENGDSQGFIETIPRLGYRFVAPVRRSLAGVETDQFSSLHHSHARIVIRHEEEVEEEEGQDTSPFGAVKTAETEGPAQVQQNFLLRHRQILAGTALCMGIVVTAYLWLRPLPRPQILDYRSISRLVDWAMPLAADGSHLYFSGPGNELWKVPITGGEPVRVPLKLPDVSVEIVDFSPTRQEMLAKRGPFSSQPAENELWVFPISTGTPRQLGDLYAHDAAWSPDGESILYAHLNGLYIAQRDGTHARLVAQLPGRASSPRWSPDSKWIRFVLTEGNSSSVWEIQSDGSNPGRILADRTEVQLSRGEWTPDGSYFIVPLFRTGRTDLWAVPRTGGRLGVTHIEAIRLTNGPMNLTFPIFNSSGRQMFAAGWVERMEIMRHDQGTNSIVPFLHGISVNGLAFSLDGQWIVYSTFPEQTLWRSRLDGSEQLKLTPDSMETLMPRWSPDGKSIAFMGRLPGEPWQILRISTDGGSAEPLIAGPDDQATPTWSPDGNMLTYAGAPWLHSFAAESTAVHSLDLRTRQVTTLPGSVGLWSPRWSPDGRYLVAETVNSQQLKLFDFTKQKWAPLAEVPSQILGYTAWSHDSRYVYFNVYDNTNNRVYRVSVEGRHKPELVVDLGSLHTLSNYGKWFTLAPDDSVLTLRDTSIRNLYALDVKLP